MATHSPNIVVIVDADMIILLNATAHLDRIVCTGTIEEHHIRNAIVDTVDGGEAAFRLRRQKYGY